MQQGLQSRRACERHIPGQDQYGRIVGQMRGGGLYGVTGPQLGFLARKFQLERSCQQRQGRLHLCRAMPSYDHDFARIHPTRGLQHMPCQG